MTDAELKAELGRLLGSQVNPALELDACQRIRVKYGISIGVGWSEPWQEQARWILKWLAARESIPEKKP